MAAQSTASQHVSAGSILTAPEHEWKLHDLWFRTKVLQALESLDTAPTTPQADVMAQARAVIAQKRGA